MPVHILTLNLSQRAEPALGGEGKVGRYLFVQKINSGDEDCLIQKVILLGFRVDF